MKLKYAKGKAEYFLLFYLILWFIINLFFLVDFPFFHTDESWLSNLSRSMADQGTLAATEDVFDLLPRHPHGIKILYHILQIVLFRLAGYSLFAARLLSLSGGCLALFLFYRLLLNLDKENDSSYPWLTLAITVVFSWDIQFVYASHMARQEILLLAMMLSTLIAYEKTGNGKGLRGFFLMGALTGIAVGIHPNVFITAWPCGLLLLRDLLKKKISLRQGMAYLGTAAIAAFLFLLISLLFNTHFFQDYRDFGETVGVAETLDIKLMRFPRFHTKLYSQLAGTYYLPDIRYFYVIAPLLLILTLIKRIPHSDRIWSGFIGISTGLLLMGKYSQPSVLFYFPFLYLGLFLCVSPLFPRPRLRLLLIPVFALLPLLSSFQLIGETNREKGLYQRYISQVAEAVPAEGIVLGGLHLEYYLDEGQLYDWRNLAFLQDNGISPEQYLVERNIEYIIIPSEMAYIYESRPVWNVLYGNMSYWYPELMGYLETDAQLLSRFPSPGYGTRIAAYRHRIPEETSIYRIPRDVSTRE